MTRRLALATAALALSLATPALAQFANSSEAVAAQNSVCDPNHSQYDAAQCPTNTLGATSVAVVPIERSRPDLPQGEVSDTTEGGDELPVAGSDQP